MRVSVGSQPPTRQIPCNMTCMWPAKDMGLVKRAHIIGSNLTVVLSMEGPAHYADLRPARRKFSAYATGNMLSDIPHPWLTNLSQIFTPSVDHRSAKDAASFIARNCNSKNQRERWVKEITKEYPVASLSSCLHNTDDPRLRRSERSQWPLRKIETMRGYRFHLAFENQNEEHMTEKLWYALTAGVVPVYMGDKRAERWAPQNSFINAHRFSNGSELGRYLRHVADNATLYESYHAWRRKRPAAHLVELFRPFEQYHIKCRICQWAAARIPDASNADSHGTSESSSIETTGIAPALAGRHRRHATTGLNRKRYSRGQVRRPHVSSVPARKSKASAWAVAKSPPPKIDND